MTILSAVLALPIALLVLCWLGWWGFRMNPEIKLMEIVSLSVTLEINGNPQRY